MNVRHLERIGFGVLLIIFIWFTWRGLIMFYSGDDMMNMYGAWSINPWRIGRSLIEIWMPIYRPLGAAVYRLFYAVFGFNPVPLYIFCWLLLVANVVLAWRFFRTILPRPFEALTALSLVLVHGTFQDLYTSAGTIYDRLWFLFTLLGLLIYARMKPHWKSHLLVCLMCILAMDSKESGIALPVLIGIYECLFVLPGSNVKARLRAIAPLYAAMGLISLVFVFLRVHRTSELTANAAYAPHASVSLWLTHSAEYFGILTYQHIPFHSVSTALLLIAMAVAAVLLRNRAMIFGLLFFIVTITPVALISSRPGYVLYVPDLGLGIWFAALFWQIGAVRAPAVCFALVTAATLWFHVRNWPQPFPPEFLPERVLTEQFRHDFPAMPGGTKMLFVTDGFPKAAWDLAFNLRLMYRDRTLRVDRIEAPPDQQPDPKHPQTYDHVFVFESGHYLELDPRDPAESQRLHILRNFSIGREMDFGHRDYPAYIVSGIMDGDNPDPSRWTTPQTKLKFDLYPAPATLTMKFWVPDFVAKTATRTMHVIVNGKNIADYPLNKDGMNEPSFSVPAEAIARNSFTIVDFNVDNPYKDPSGTAFGVVLMRAGFTYR